MRSSSAIHHAVGGSFAAMFANSSSAWSSVAGSRGGNWSATLRVRNRSMNFKSMPDFTPVTSKKRSPHGNH
jgi:hypothetical protein